MKRPVLRSQEKCNVHVPSKLLEQLGTRLARLPRKGNGNGNGNGAKHPSSASAVARTAPRRPARNPAGTSDGQHQAKARILIVDQHPMVRDWISKSLNELGDLEICGEATTAQEALEAVETLKPHLVVTELSIGTDFGIELIKDLKARWSSLPVLVLSAQDEAVYAVRVLHAGGLGYISKAAQPAEIVRAIRRVLTGQVYVSDAMAGLLLGRLAHSPVALPPSETDLLSDREMEVFELIGQGKSSREISVQLHIGIKTVESYKTRVKVKLHLDNARELLQHAVQWLLTERAS